MSWPSKARKSTTPQFLSCGVVSVRAIVSQLPYWCCISINIPSRLSVCSRAEVERATSARAIKLMKPAMIVLPRRILNLEKMASKNVLWSELRSRSEAIKLLLVHCLSVEGPRPRYLSKRCPSFRAVTMLKYLGHSVWWSTPFGTQIRKL